MAIGYFEQHYELILYVMVCAMVTAYTQVYRPSPSPQELTTHAHLSLVAAPCVGAITAMGSWASATTIANTTPWQ